MLIKLACFCKRSFVLFDHSFFGLFSLVCPFVSFPFVGKFVFLSVCEGFFGHSFAADGRSNLLFFISW